MIRFPQIDNDPWLKETLDEFDRKYPDKDWTNEPWTIPVYFKMTLPAISPYKESRISDETPSQQIKWADNISKNIFDKVQFTCNGKPLEDLEEHSSDFGKELKIIIPAHTLWKPRNN